MAIKVRHYHRGVVPTPPPPPPYSRPKVGLVTGEKTQSVFETREANYGTLAAAVSYIGFTRGAGMPASAINYQTVWQLTGSRPDVHTIYSFRPDPTLDWVGGSQDAAITTFLNTIPANRYFVLNVWMEIDGYIKGRGNDGAGNCIWGSTTNPRPYATIADKQARVAEWRRMIAHIGQRVKVHGNPFISVSMNLTSYAFDPAQTSGGVQFMNQGISFWDTSMDSTVDLIMMNLYNGTGNTALTTRVPMWEPATVFTPFEAYRNARGKPGALCGETGSWEAPTAASVGRGPTAGQPQTKAEWWARLWDLAKAATANGGIRYLCAWDVPGYYGTAPGTPEDDIDRVDSTTPALNAFRAIVADSKVLG